MAAVRAGGRVLLEMRDRVAKRFDRAADGVRMFAIAVADGRHFEHVRIVGQWQFRHGPVHLFF